jgi:hypothetical protein
LEQFLLFGCGVGCSLCCKFTFLLIWFWAVDLSYSSASTQRISTFLSFPLIEFLLHYDYRYSHTFFAGIL